MGGAKLSIDVVYQIQGDQPFPSSQGYLPLSFTAVIKNVPAALGKPQKRSFLVDSPLRPLVPPPLGLVDKTTNTQYSNTLILIFGYVVSNKIYSIFQRLQIII